MTDVTYTGNYQTVDNYNPYKYTSQAPFGSEEDWTRPKKDIEVCPDFRTYGDNCFLKRCKVCAKEGRTPEALQKLRKTGWFRKDGTQKGIRDEDFGILKRHDRGTDRSKVAAKYGGGTYYGLESEGYEPEPLNMQGAVGVLIALAGLVILKL